MQFRRHLAIRYGGWRDRYVRMPMDMRLWKMSMMGVAHIDNVTGLAPAKEVNHE